MKDERTVDEILDELQKALSPIIAIAHMADEDKQVMCRSMKRKLSILTETVHAANHTAIELGSLYALIDEGWVPPKEVRP